MNRVILGILCGIVFGLLDTAMVVFGKHPDKSLAMILQAFFSRFAIGFLAANVTLRLHPAISGALVGLLISLPDAFAMKSYVGILGTGLIFGALAGWAAKTWASLFQDHPPTAFMGGTVRRGGLALMHRGRDYHVPKT